MKRSDGTGPAKSRFHFVIVIILLLTPLSASAYLDPTTGSMLISAIVGIFASIVLALKTYWYRIKGLFKRKPTQPDSEDGSV